MTVYATCTHLDITDELLEVSSADLRTYSGCIPNIKAEKRRVMTPKKNETFSRVRTTFADCHDAAKEAIRVEIFQVD